jgi:predicted transcriptional regulator
MDEIINDKKLTFAAKGLLIYLLTNKEKEKRRMDNLIEQSPSGRDSIKRIIKELEHFGYIKRNKIRNKSGRFEQEVLVYESPFYNQSQPIN